MRSITEPLGRCEEQEVLAEEWVSKTLTQVREYKAQADERLRAVFGMQYAIDEMALLFNDSEWAWRWIQSAVRVPEVTLFNAAHDTVSTRPIRSRYDVHYWFLTMPYDGDPKYDVEQPWRLECMMSHGGSPLHDTLSRTMRGKDILAVHASFKCPDEEAYGVAVKTLGDNGYEAAQYCQSTYGRFSYWSAAEEGAGGVYLKPRVNLRDDAEDLRLMED